jgi:molybdenum cofactor cytidylyltransferase
MLAAVILAAGESRRMGEPKALLRLRGKTFIEHLCAATRHPRVELMRIVLGADALEIQAQLPSIPPESFLINSDWRKGQLSSIHAAIHNLPEGETEGVLLCPVDHPLISAQLVGQLIAEFDASRKPIVLPTFRGRRGHPVIFSAALFGELLAASPEIGARQVVWAHANDVAQVATEEEGVVLNLNDPETVRARRISDSGDLTPPSA